MMQIVVFFNALFWLVEKVNKATEQATGIIAMLHCEWFTRKKKDIKLMPTFHLLIKGRVRGVLYRATAKEVAKNLGITGWIKNTMDGNVEALVTGTELLMQNFIAWCRSGPSEAQVTDVIITQQPEEEFEKFSIVH